MGLELKLELELGLELLNLNLKNFMSCFRIQKQLLHLHTSQSFSLIPVFTHKMHKSQ